MTARLTQEYVDEWLATNRPDFVPAPGWVYVSNGTPIPGRCRICGGECAPRLNGMKDSGEGHCRPCGLDRSAMKNSARGQAQARRVAFEKGYTVLKTYKRKYASATVTFFSFRCSCGNEWDTSISHFISDKSGCASCAEFGFDDSKPGAIYLLARSVDGVEQRGFGISNDWPRRIKGYERFGWLPLDVVEFESGQDARDFESVINRVVGETAGRSVEPDSIYYKNREAFAEGYGVPMFRDVRSLISWAAVQVGLREEAA